MLGYTGLVNGYYIVVIKLSTVLSICVILVPITSRYDHYIVTTIIGHTYPSIHHVFSP